MTTLHPVVIAAARDQQRFAQPCHLVLAAHLLDSGIPLGGASERMPRDFFKTSRCSKSLAFSARKRRISASRASTLRLDCGSLLAALDSRSKCAQRYSSGGRIPSSAATFAALRPLARHSSNASCLY